MQRLRTLCLVAALNVSSPAFGQDTVGDEFRKKQLNENIWCPCQINVTNAPLEFLENPDSTGDRFLRVTADEASLGGNKCRWGEDGDKVECVEPVIAGVFSASSKSLEHERIDETEPLGPSLIQSLKPKLALFAARKNHYCDEEVVRRAKEAGEEDTCIQRQELRFHTSHRRKLDKPWRYSIRFRMPKEIQNRTDSIRWVVAQWKHTKLSETYGREFDEDDDWGQSPFLAHRFDDGVSHITIQDEHCRCLVASARLPDSSYPQLAVNGRPAECQSTHPDDPNGTACRADIKLEFGKDPILSAPLGEWVEMHYVVTAGRTSPATIKVFEGDRPIVTITGKIGYKTKKKAIAKAKFKFGHYRDYMPFVHTLDVDWVRVSKEPPR